MMLVKWHVGKGMWRVEEAHSDLRYPLSTVTHEVTVETRDDMSGQSLWTTEGRDAGSWFDAVDLPHPWWDDVIVNVISARGESDVGEGVRLGRAFVHTLSWRDADGKVTLLVTDAPVFIMNERGDTVDKV